MHKRREIHVIPIRSIKNSPIAISIALTLVLLPLISASAAPTESRESVITPEVRNPTNASYDSYNAWVSTSILIDSYPSYYTPAEATIKWNIDSDAVDDVEYKIHFESLDGLYIWESPVTNWNMDPTGNDGADGYAETSETGMPYHEGVSGLPNDLPIDIPMNGTWTFSIRDGVNNGSNRGRIDWWELYFIYFAPPTGVTATDGTNTSVTVTWNSIAPEIAFDHYKVNRATSPTGTKQFVTMLAPAYITPTYSIQDTGVTAYQTYYYFVRSCEVAGCAWFSNSDAGSAMLVPPPISATDGAYTDKVQITFIENPGALYYQAWRASSPGGPYSLLGNTADLTEIYEDTTASPSVMYYYKGKSCTAYGCSDLSSFWDSGSASASPPSIQASDGEFWYVYLEWDTMPGAHTYRVYRSTTTTPPDPDDYYARDIYDPTTTYNDLGADPYTTYYYWVVSCVEPVCGPFSDYDSGWRKFRPPYNVAATDGTQTDRVTISWGVDDSVDFFEVYRAATVDGEKTLLGLPTGLSYDDLSATPGITYYYALKACDSTFCSDFSASNTGWRAWTAPTSIAASDGSSTAWVDVSWTGVPGATGYQVFRCTGTGTGSCGSAIGSPTSSPYKDTGASAGVDYYYRVKACAGASNCSAFSVYDVGWRTPAAPGNIQASDGTYTDKIHISWNAVAGATSYNLYRYIADTGIPNLIASPSGTTYDDTAPAPGRDYWYWLETCVGVNCSALSENDGGWRSILAPGNVQATDGTHVDKVVISWNAVGVAASSRVYRADSESGTKTQIGTPSSASFDDMTAMPGRTYYYWITSCAWGKCGDYSAFDTGWRFGYAIHLPLIMR
ncbi:MAG: hypothetical protein E4G99_07215 [Anaerolineales bacterium]|nr:MAG: hypothetical protein E4G99_07215 [Anaerolineales bacterium]